MKILVIGPSWVGDMMVSHSLYRTLKAQHPDATIDVIAPAWCFPLLSRMPEVGQARAMPIGHGVLNMGQRYALGHALRSHAYDRAYVLPNSFKSALIPFFARVPKRIGWRGEMRYGVLNDLRVLDEAALPTLVQRYVALAYEKDDLPQPLLRPQCHVDMAEVAHTTSLFDIPRDQPMVGLCPGAEFGPAKRWPHYHYADLANRLIQAGVRIVLFGSVNDAPTCERIASTVQSSLCLNLAGKTTLEDVVVLMSFCQAIVSNDSGLMHIAAALNKPQIALYGPTSPDFMPPLSDNATVIRLIAGQPKIRNIRQGDAEGGYHESLIDITPQRVFDALMSRLQTA